MKTEILARRNFIEFTVLQIKLFKILADEWARVKEINKK